MTTYGQKYRCIDNCYCGNDNDNKIVLTSDIQNGYDYCCCNTCDDRAVYEDPKM